MSYTFCHHEKLNIEALADVEQITMKRRGKTEDESPTCNNVIIMGDTETSKKDRNHVDRNHVCAWTISTRIPSTKKAAGRNLFTVWGHKPTTHVSQIREMHEFMGGDKTYIYYHNLSYDWTFLRQFYFQELGYPIKMLCTKSHYPIMIEFKCGIVLRDSLILAQRKLEKWAENLDVEHKKAVGSWDYEKIRNQDCAYNQDELKYIECDTLAGVECLDAMLLSCHKSIYSMHLTATGIARSKVTSESFKNRGKSFFLKTVPDVETHKKLERIFHGGFTHANRMYLGKTIESCKVGPIECYDISSSYPFVMCTGLFPMERFSPPSDNFSINHILESKNDYAYIMKFSAEQIQLKDFDYPMPVIQISKLEKSVNSLHDNGRLLQADYIEMYINDIQLNLIMSQYEILGKSSVSEVQFAKKCYLPKWLRDAVFNGYAEKCQLKTGDKVLYDIAKCFINSMYGMSTQHPCKPDIIEDYATGEYREDLSNFVFDDEYAKYIDKKTKVLLYQWGVYVTSQAMENLFYLGQCITPYNPEDESGGDWLYSDTDSVFAFGFDRDRISDYNNRMKHRLLDAGYSGVIADGKLYWLGTVELDKEITEFRTLGAKKYCWRDLNSNQLKITVAGVPKNGAKCLLDDISNFTPGFIFPGSETGKKTHTYFNNPIYIDNEGNETGDSIDLSPCDYRLDIARVDDWTQYIGQDNRLHITHEEGVQIFE